jgi:SAM domain (Sterile alpha motif)
VVQWLKGLGLEKHWPMFEKSGFDTPLTLSDLNEGMLRDMGIMALGHVRLILRKVKEIAATI